MNKKTELSKTYIFFYIVIYTLFYIKNHFDLFANRHRLKLEQL